MSVAGKHVIVTGGGTGVGAAIAQAMAFSGARVTVMGRREAPLRQVSTQHKSIGWIACDVTDGEALRAAFRQSRGLNGPVDVVVANAGAAHSVAFKNASINDFQSMLGVNLIGVFNSFQAALADMEQSGDGRMIAVASTAGLKGYPYVAGYCAAKHGVIGLIKSLALELAQSGITVNAICPGFIETPLLERSIQTIVEKTQMTPDQAAASLRRDNPQRRFIQPDEVAGAAVWLCSDAARSVNGHTMSISGGEI